jgi:hypothetical protein
MNLDGFGFGKSNLKGTRDETQTSRLKDIHKADVLIKYL